MSFPADAWAIDQKDVCDQGCATICVDAVHAGADPVLQHAAASLRAHWGM